ncbi:hypothetical protein CDL12_17007 [Handroanthus impetiginosus]|uniref:DUF4283 domain-containing protein n=1 Tax=Handroanthus impetiginosus TaxID=429701 RepID=A0A2G9GYP5_9LAMI|nr:hypothetical protein CDL12_17007 [Handroanthus impetiginosus]
MEEATNILERTLYLTEEEEEELIAAPSTKTRFSQNHNLSVVGHIAAIWPYSATTLKSNIQRLLQPVKGMDFVNIAENRFVLTFNHKLDMQHMLEGCPWIIDKHKLVDTDDPATVTLEKMSIILHANNLSLQCGMEEATNILERTLYLTEEEEEELIAAPSTKTRFSQNHNLSVVGHIAAIWPYSATTLKSNIQRLLQPVKGMDFVNIAENRFVLTFNHKLDMQHMLEGNLETARQIGNKIREFVELLMQNNEFQGPKLRIKIKIDVIKPLMRGINLRISEVDKHWIDFEY